VCRDAITPPSLKLVLLTQGGWLAGEEVFADGEFCLRGEFFPLNNADE
jgi:hypothetical protein